MDCPLCDHAPITMAPSLLDEVKVTCPRCGEFRVDSMLLPLKALTQELKPYLSMYTRICYESGREPIPIDQSNVERLAETYKHTTVVQKLGYLLRLLAKRSAFLGDIVKYNQGYDYPAIAALNITESGQLLSALQELGYIKLSPLMVTVKGWEHLGAQTTPELSGRCFVAMSFDPSLDSAYEFGIKPGIEGQAGYEAIRIDKVHHNEKICDKILAEIRQVQFLVADVTLHRQGVYFEAGFAMGLGRPVIWTCREDDKDKVQFDTRQYNHIFWKAPDDLRDQLRDRIIATIGRRLRS